MRFPNPQRALRWAFETSNKPVGISINGDTKQQTEMILDLCERSLPPLHMAYIRIQFGREARGFDVLVDHLAANGLHSRRTIEKIIRAYCGENIGLREIRKSMSCGMLKAVSYRNRAYDELDAIHLQAMERLRVEMEKKGLLLDTSAAHA